MTSQNSSDLSDDFSSVSSTIGRANAGSDLNTSEYAERRRRVLELARRLRSVGAHAEIDIPSVVVIGGQSAGKSSLVEAVSRISVPRDAGTCTRCPMECTVSRISGPWTCKITLRIDFNDQGRKLEGHEVKTIDFGGLLTSRSEVEMGIRRAQAAILMYPRLPAEHFVNLSREQLEPYRPRNNALLGRSSPNQDDEPNPLKFSKNCVCIQIYDPDATDLSFIDLPGLIQNEEQDIIDTVADLVRSKIESKSSIILVTVPMSDDLENQQAIKLAREADPEGQRTIVVLTKPDTVPSTSTSRLQQWSEVLEGRLEVLVNGYYAVKQPDDADRIAGVTQTDARRQEMHFFDRTEPWKSLSARHRLGTERLVENVSNLLIKRIESAIPDICRQLEELLEKCRAELDALPPHIEYDALQETLDLVAKYCTQYEEIVMGNTDRKEVVQHNRQAYEELKVAIRLTAPNFYPVQNAEYESTKFSLNAVEGEVDQGTCIYLEDVRKVIKSQTTWELPHNVPYSAKTYLILKFVEKWDLPARSCFDKVYRTQQQTLSSLARERFQRFPALLELIEQFVLEIVNNHHGRTLVAIDQALEMERIPIFTQNTHYLETVKSQMLSEYAEGWRAQRKRIQPPTERIDRSGVATAAYRVASSGAFVMDVSDSPPDPRTKLLPLLQKINYSKFSSITYEQIMARLELGEYHREEIEVMADVRAYFQCAYKRIIDAIPLAIERSQNRAVATSLRREIVHKLDPFSSDAKERFECLLAEDPRISQRRQSLTSQARRLEAVLEEVRAATRA